MDGQMGLQMQTQRNRDGWGNTHTHAHTLYSCICASCNSAKEQTFKETVFAKKSKMVQVIPVRVCSLTSFERRR